jgi:uroporphyrinogen decarboxylase
MTNREVIRNIIARKPAPRCGFWLGDPHADTLPLYYEHFGVSSLEELHRELKSDLRWITPHHFPSTYQHPQGKRMFDLWKHKKSLGEAGPLGQCETVKQVEEYDWPNPDYLHFEECLGALREAGDVYRASGFWSPFFHDIMDLFGAEEFMLKMHEQPDVVHAAFDRVCGFYYEANERFFRAAGRLIDGFFFGNDFGTQRDLLISPAQFGQFVLPRFRRFADQAHRFGYQVILHSCGSIHRVIGTLIESGVECLHPLQSRAKNMDAGTLAKDFGGRIAFLGGIDTQDLLVHATPADVKAEVRRVKRLLGPNLIVSPSHEKLLPNVSPANVEAMAREALAQLPK